jgi:hypothetical protein
MREPNQFYKVKIWVLGVRFALGPFLEHPAAGCCVHEFALLDPDSFRPAITGKNFLTAKRADKSATSRRSTLSTTA